MKTLILTALNNNYPFWYNQFIPFILSLTATDYTGDIGVISYDLSAEKQAVLQQHGIKVFPASHYFADLFVDRHYSAAHIAEQYAYDIVAFYDTDIWFPNSHLSIFEYVSEPNKIYASYDIACANFIYSCVDEYGVENVHQKIAQVMQENGGYVWQVGLLAAHTSAWTQYRHYLEQLLVVPQFRIEYGVDTTAFNLYAIDTQQVAHLPERYNCLPMWGLQITWHTYESGQTEPRFLLNGENVEGLHNTGNLRRWGWHDYEYPVYHTLHFFNEGKHYRPRTFQYQSLPSESFAQAFAPREHETLPTLSVRQVNIESTLSTLIGEDDDLLIRVAGCTLIELHNPHLHAITFRAVHQEVVGYLPCRGTFIQIGERRIDCKYANTHNYS